MMPRKPTDTKRNKTDLDVLDERFEHGGVPTSVIDDQGEKHPTFL
jgi:hypothetical protein